MHVPAATISRSADRVLSVTELTRSIKRHLESGFGDLWVEGEQRLRKPLINTKEGVQQVVTWKDALMRVRDVLNAAGRKDPASVPAPLTREVVIAATEEKARELAERHLMINYKNEYGGGTWNHPLIGAEDSTRVDVLDEIGKDRFIVGTPEQCIQQIQAFREKVGMDELICRLFFPGMPHEHILEELRLLAREVLPAFKS